MKRGFTKAFLLALALLLGTELGMRLFFARNMSGRFEYGYNPTSGFIEHDDGRVDLVRTGGRRFREQSFRKQKTPGVWRIVIIGDSVARGSSVESAYGGQLQALLKKEGIRAECLNMAVGGYGAARKKVVLHQALTYSPDLVILHVNISNEFEDEREWKRSLEFKDWHPRHWLMKSVMIRRLYEAKTEKVFWELLPAEIRQQTMVSDADAELMAQRNESTQARWRAQVQRLTAESVDEIKRAGGQAFLVGQAFYDSTAPEETALDDKGIEDILKQPPMSTTPQISMKTVMKGGDLPALYSDTSHMRSAGHQRLAAAILAKLKQSGMLPGADGR